MSVDLDPVIVLPMAMINNCLVTSSRDVDFVIDTAQGFYSFYVYTNVVE